MGVYVYILYSSLLGMTDPGIGNDLVLNLNLCKSLNKGLKG